MTDEARAALEASLGYRFVRPEHLAVALTHRSTGDGTHNETLEFLGDAVLSLAVSDLLMRRFPTATEGDLSKRRASLVNAEELAQKARAMDLGRWLSVGKGEERSGGRAKEKILAAAYEAVLGAVYLDAGWEPARQVVESHFAPHMTREPEAPGHRDYKTRLQELTQRVQREMPAYTLVDFDVRVPLGWAGLNDDTYFQLNVTNVFDKLYVGNFGGALLNTNVPNVNIGAPRAIIGTLVVQFR